MARLTDNQHIRALWETIKELGRLALFAALAAISGWLTMKLKGVEPSSLYYIVMTIALRLIDRFIHTNESTPLKGLAPF